MVRGVDVRGISKHQLRRSTGGQSELGVQGAERSCNISIQTKWSENWKLIHDVG